MDKLTQLQFNQKIGKRDDVIDFFKSHSDKLEKKVNKLIHIFAIQSQ